MSRLRIATLLSLALIVSPVALADDPPKLVSPVKVDDPLKPIPPVAIPDDPPPHEGAMIDFPVTIEPPDLIYVEVLEALPGRPITGQHLVKPDGTISLGFYGDVHVRGLTTRQAKVKILLHLRKCIADHTLGLLVPLGGGAEAEADLPIPAELPAPGRTPFDLRPPLPLPPEVPSEKASPPQKKPDAEVKPPAKTEGRTTSSISRIERLRKVRGRSSRRATAVSQFKVDQPQVEQNPKPPPPAAQPKEEVRTSKPVVEGPYAEHFRKLPPQVPAGLGQYRMIDDPADSDRVFVDMAMLNTMVYYVQGDVGVPARLPFTGKETVLDALNYAGRLVASGEPSDIHVYRPARGDKPAKDYRINLDAIHKGDKTANLQIFPGDRLFVGRNPIVAKTVELDRAAALISSQLNAMYLYSYTARSMGTINFPPISGSRTGQSRLNGQNAPTSSNDPLLLTPAQRDAMIKDWAEFLWSISSKEGGAMLDEKAFKEALMKKLTPAPEPKQ